MTARICILLLLATIAHAQGNAYRQEIDAWHASREARLQAEDGWLSLIGLDPLYPGDSTVGAAESCTITLAADLPDVVGLFTVSPDTIRFSPAPGVPVQVDDAVLAGPAVARSDADGAPTVFHLGTVRWYVITRGDRLFLRSKDSASPVRTGFIGIPRYPVDPAWRITARLVTEGQPGTVAIANVLGQLEERPSPGVLEFVVAGQTVHLTPTGRPGEPLFIVFSDGTSGRETYGAGRFLSAEAPDERGRVVLDFNKAYNPPCAFTAYATCPVPPMVNKLPVAITAGEQSTGHH